MTHINEIEGIGAVQGKKLEAAGIQSVEALLQEAATPKGRKELEAKTGIAHHQLLRWVNQADLFRVKGIGRQYAELLEKAGVDSVRELAQRNAEHLHAKLVEVNEAHHHVHVVPSAEHVKRWVEEAKALPRVVQY
jgi:predicted flap endonuclease-1-like 5' DNA nuclease